MLLGERLKTLLATSHQSQATFAELLGITRARLSNYITGRSEPDYATLVRIADMFQVSTDYLLGYSPQGTQDFNNTISLPELSLGPEKPAEVAHGSWIPLFLNQPSPQEDTTPPKQPEPLGWILDSRSCAKLDWGTRAPYALLVNDESLMPKIMPNDVIFIQPRFFSCPYWPQTLAGGLFSVRLTPTDSIGLSLKRCAMQEDILICFTDKAVQPPILLDMNRLLHSPLTGKAVGLWREFPGQDLGQDLLHYCAVRK